jgi:hypothetical protein
METSTEIAVQFDEQSQGTSAGVQRNRLLAQHLRCSNPVATLAGSIDADKWWFFRIPRKRLGC